MALRDKLAAEASEAAEVVKGSAPIGMAQPVAPIERASGDAVFGEAVGGEDAASGRGQRGRPADVVAFGEAPPGNPSNPATPQRFRKPFGAYDLHLNYPLRAGFRRYWVNDEPGRIERALEAGYTHVQENGRPVKRLVGVAPGGGGEEAYLMEIPMQWYQEDRRRAEQERAERETAIRSGRLDPSGAGKQYVPSTGISIRHGLGRIR